MKIANGMTAVSTSGRTPGELEAAGIISDYLVRLTSPDGEYTATQNSIVVEENMTFDELGDDGYIIAEKDGELRLIAPSRDGLVYAAYTLLEDYAGCRYYTSEDEYVPSVPFFVVPDGTYDKRVPAMKYREVYYHDAMNATFADKLRLNGQGSRTKDGRFIEGHRGWGFWCHSFFTLIPPKKYFEPHPEWFSLIDGKRVDNGQLCCTNDDMIDEAIINLRGFMSERPAAKYWSVSQNDTTLPCQCDKCRALDDEAGSHIGSIMYFVNRVAEAFPDKIISTLSYWYSRTAPKQLKMRDNVHIMLCDIECDRSKPIALDNSEKSFGRDLAIWREYCGNVFLWDYDIQFSNLVAPFPNFRVLAPNMRYFYENNVRSIFNQGNRDRRGDFWALREYLLAKLSWDPYCDVDRLTREFLDGYYGAAGTYIGKYIDALGDELERSGEGLSIFGQPEKEAFLRRELMPLYEGILSVALDAVSGDETLTLRINEVCLGLVYVKLKAKYYDTEEEKAEMIDFFRRTAKAVGLVKLEEWVLTVDDFLASL